MVKKTAPDMSEDLFSPNRDYKVSFSSYEISMSHWIDQPYLIRVSDNAFLFDLSADVWSAWQVRWLSNSTVELVMRKYPGLLDCTVRLNASTNQADATSGVSSVAGEFLAVTGWLLDLK